jgi:hypothetical protein
MVYPAINPFTVQRIADFGDSDVTVKGPTVDQRDRHVGWQPHEKHAMLKP